MHVKQHHPRLQPGDDRDRLVDGRGLAEHPDARVEFGAQPGTEDRMVVDDHDRQERDIRARPVERGGCLGDRIAGSRLIARHGPDPLLRFRRRLLLRWVLRRLRLRRPRR